MVIIVLASRTWEIVFIPSGSPRMERQSAVSSVVAEREADLPRPVLLIEKWLRLLRASGLEEGDVAGSSRFGGLFCQVTAPSQLTSSVSPGSLPAGGLWGAGLPAGGLVAFPGSSRASCGCGCYI